MDFRALGKLLSVVLGELQSFLLFHVSQKVDGEFMVLVYRDGEACSINPGGTVRVGLPWLAKAAELFKNRSVTEAMVAGELYVARDDRRPRVHDVVTVPRHLSRGPRPD